MPKLANKCIKSWKKFCPEYELIEWNERNFDIEKAPLYVRQAYEAKKWAFVSDYVRLKALYEFGGLYFDTDVEVIKPFDTSLDYDCIFGFESIVRVSTAFIASKKEMPILIELLSDYDNISFIKGDGSYDQTTNVERITRHFLEKGLKLDNNFQIIEGVAVFPSDYFCAKSLLTDEIIITENTFCIHNFSSSCFDFFIVNHNTCSTPVTQRYITLR